MPDQLLSDLVLDQTNRTANHRLGDDFIGQCLPRSNVYRRAAAFFSSSVFRVAPRSWFEFFRARGRAYFVISPHLSRRDISVIRQAVYERPTYVKAFSLDDYDDPTKRKALPAAAFLRGLIATDQVDIRVALRQEPHTRDIYHEKIGIFSDTQGNIIAFSGSVNESYPAYAGNFERIDIFTKHYPADRRRALAIERHFNELWRDETTGVEVLRLTEALNRNVFIEHDTLPGERKDDILTDSGTVTDIHHRHLEVLVPASGITLRDHQREAIKAWAKAGGRGVLEMATGSGKTITALTLASKLYDSQGPPFVVLVVAPLIHLVDQWQRITKLYGLDPIRCAEGRDRWTQALSTAIDNVNAGRRPVLSILSTISTMQSDVFRRIISGVRAPLLMIADEVHNYGAGVTFSALPDHASARVGLSATPDRPYDSAGNARLKEYFGETVFTYGLRKRWPTEF